MTKLKELHEKLDEYNRAENEHWMILIDATRLEYIFVVHSENINLFPSWWPVTDVAETIEKALDLVPKEKRYTIRINSEQSNGSYEGHLISLTGLKADYINKIIDECK